MGDSRIKDVSSLLSSFFDEDKLRRGERYSDFFSSWPALVGSRLAAHSRVADVDKGFLVVEAEHPGWIQLLQIRQSSILESVAHRFPELGLRGIVFRLSRQGGPVRMQAPSEEEAARDKEGSAEPEAGAPASQEPSPGEAATENIKDPEFQALFSSLKKAMQRKG
jgi:hypothetical protein